MVKNMANINEIELFNLLKQTSTNSNLQQMNREALKNVE